MHRKHSDNMTTTKVQQQPATEVWRVESSNECITNIASPFQLHNASPPTLQQLMQILLHNKTCTSFEDTNTKHVLNISFSFSVLFSLCYFSAQYNLIQQLLLERRLSISSKIGTINMSVIYIVEWQIVPTVTPIKLHFHF